VVPPMGPMFMTWRLGPTFVSHVVDTGSRVSPAGPTLVESHHHCTTTIGVPHLCICNHITIVPPLPSSHNYRRHGCPQAYSTPPRGPPTPSAFYFTTAIAASSTSSCTNPFLSRHAASTWAPMHHSSGRYTRCIL
jgi:hypothetical protein